MTPHEILHGFIESTLEGSQKRKENARAALVDLITEKEGVINYWRHAWNEISEHSPEYAAYVLKSQQLAVDLRNQIRVVEIALQETAICREEIRRLRKILEDVGVPT